MLNKRHKIILTSVVIGILIAYAFVLRPIFIEELKAGNGVMSSFIAFWLPRFQEFVEKFGSELISIADSWAIRITFGLSVFLVFDKKIKKGLQKFIRLDQPSFITRLQLILLTVVVSWYQLGMWFEMEAQCRMNELYQGLPLLGFISLPLPEWEVVRNIQSIVIGIPLLYLFPFVVRNFRILPAVLLMQSVLFFYLQLLFLGFGKIDHTYATLNFALLAFAFLVINPEASWPVQSAKVWIALAYFLAAMEKITLSPIAWLSGESLMHYSLLHVTAYTNIIKYHPWLAPPGSWFTLIFEAGLLLSILIGRAHHWIVIGIIGFHIGTWFLMDIGAGVNNPWVITLIIIFVLPDLITTLSADHRKPA
jgi:hypothetical protein